LLQQKKAFIYLLCIVVDSGQYDFYISIGIEQLLLLQQSLPSGSQSPDVNAGKKSKEQRAECRVLRLITIFFAKWVPVSGCQCREEEKSKEQSAKGRVQSAKSKKTFFQPIKSG